MFVPWYQLSLNHPLFSATSSVLVCTTAIDMGSILPHYKYLTFDCYIKHISIPYYCSIVFQIRRKLDEDHKATLFTLVFVKL